MSDQTKPALKILRKKALQAKMDIGGSTIHDRTNPNALGYDPTFPKPIKLGTGKAVGWIEAEIDQWITQQIDKRNHKLATTKK